jgi:putative ABC transport system permease protein
MLMARGAGRAREIATRLALGASRRRIVRGLVVESLLLGTIGVVLGLAGALALVGMLRALLPALPLPITLDFRIDWRVMTFSALLSLAASLIAGLVPALQAARTALLTAMRQDAWSRSVSRLRRGFVVAQVAMSMLLVVCAILFGRALVSAGRIDPGFDMANLDVVSLEFRLGGYDEDGGQRFAEDILPRVTALPGVTAAAFSRVLPLSGSGVGLGPLWRPGQPRQDDTATWVEWNIVTGNYFETLGIPLRRGRLFSPADTPSAPRAAVVSEAFAAQVWPGQEPIGQTLINQRAGASSELTVIGVVADAQLGNLSDEPEPLIYVAGTQEPEAQGWLLIRTTGQSSLPAVRRLLADIDPNLPIVETTTLEQVAALSLTPNRIAAWLAGAVGVIGLFLATLGIYGITAFSVSQRTREIGVRVALGAVSRDPISFLGGTLLFAAAAFLASLVPAMRAAGLNPVDALRSE